MPAASRPDPWPTAWPATSSGHRGAVPVVPLAPAADAGLDTVEVLEILAECTFAGLVGSGQALTGGVPLDGFRQPPAWQPLAG